MNYIKIILGLTFIVAGTGCTLKANNTNDSMNINKAVVASYQNFACTGMDTFTFRYPLFADWTVTRGEVAEPTSAVEIEQLVCMLYFQSEQGVAFGVPPTLIVWQQTLSGDSDWLTVLGQDYTSTQTNSQGLVYAVSAVDRKAAFQVNNKLITINGVALPPNDFGFNQELFWQSVLDTFTKL